MSALPDFPTYAFSKLFRDKEAASDPGVMRVWKVFFWSLLGGSGFGFWYFYLKTTPHSATAVFYFTLGVATWYALLIASLTILAWRHFLLKRRKEKIGIKTVFLFYVVLLALFTGLYQNIFLLDPSHFQINDPVVWDHRIDTFTGIVWLTKQFVVYTSCKAVTLECGGFHGRSSLVETINAGQVFLSGIAIPVFVGIAVTHPRTKKPPKPTKPAQPEPTQTNRKRPNRKSGRDRR